MNRRKKYLILDVETAQQQLCYDVGGIVTDNYGEVYAKFSYIIKEVFSDYNIMRTSFYANKQPLYIEKLANNEAKYVDIMTCQSEILQLMQIFNINIVMAYNANFDITALNKTLYAFTGETTFFPEDTIIQCIWSMATDTLCKQKKYFKFCLQNANGISAKNNLKTSAEVVYSFISNNPLFEEEHTGLEDSQIEKEIFVKIIKLHKKFSKEPTPMAWKRPQQSFKEYQKKFEKI